MAKKNSDAYSAKDAFTSNKKRLPVVSSAVMVRKAVDSQSEESNAVTPGSEMLIVAS